MTPPPELLGGLKRLPLIGPVLAHNGRRRALFGVSVAVCAALTLFPERYRAAVTLTPSDPSSLGLQSALGQLSAFNTVFGNQAAVEIALRIARSKDVRDKVASKLDLDHKLGTAGPVETSRWLTRNVEIRSLRGGIIQMELKLADADLARSIVGSWAEATRAQLAEIAVRQTEYKRGVLEKLVADANLRMVKAQAAYDRFRLGRRTAEPGQEIGAISGRIEALRQAIKAKNLELRSALKFATTENFQVQRILSERAAFEEELARTVSQQATAKDTLGNAVTAGTELIFLERDLIIARGLFDSYSRYLLGTYVEDLTSTANIRILETPFVDTERQINMIPAAIGLLLLLLALAFEMQVMRRPLGSAR